MNSIVNISDIIMMSVLMLFYCPTGAKQYAPLGGSRPSDCYVAVMLQWSNKIGPISIIDNLI